MSIDRHARRQAGLTMIELIVFIIIIGVAAAGVLATMTTLSSKSGDPLQRKQAMLRAESLLEEVSLAKFTYCHPDDANAETATNAGNCASMPEGFGPRAGDTRPYFNINDYVSASGTLNSFNPADASGNTSLDATGALMQPTGYNAMVTITPVSGFGPTGLQIGSVASPVTAADAEVLHISVRVSYGNGQEIVLDRYRTRYAPNSTP